MNDIANFFKTKIFNNMAPLPISNDIKEEIFKLENISPSQIKYPYKPFLLLSMVIAINDPKTFFTEKIDIFNYKIIENFYNLVTSDYLLFSILGKHNSKKEWHLGLSPSNISSISSIMRQGPIRYLESKWFEFDKKDKTVKLNFDLDLTLESLQLFESFCVKAIKEAIPWYESLDINNILSKVDTELMMLYTNGDEIESSEYVKRKYQHIFRKQVLDRDKKCIICCVDNSAVLCACHIKPYAKSALIEKYDANNGITLCSNHHLLFDKGYFSFDSSWNLIISKRLPIQDDSLFFKQFEDCYQMIFKNFPSDSAKDYLNYHKKIIFN